MEIDYSTLPEHMRDAMRRYIEQGIAPGGFLLAVLTNNLKEAVARADDINRESLVDYVRFLYNEAPSECQGSQQKVQQWIAEGGLEGREV